MRAAATAAYPCEGGCGTAMDIAGYYDDCALDALGIDQPKIEVAQNSGSTNAENQRPAPSSSSNGTGSAHVVQGRNEQPPLLSAGCSPVNVPVPVPSIEKERADLFVLLDDKAAPVVHVESKELPHWATPSMRQVLKDVAYCSGKLLAAGDDGTVIYAVEPMAQRLGLSAGAMSIALKRLRACGALKLVKVLPQPPPRQGTRVYAVVSGRPDLRVVDDDFAPREQPLPDRVAGAVKVAGCRCDPPRHNTYVDDDGDRRCLACSKRREGVPE